MKHPMNYFFLCLIGIASQAVFAQEGYPPPCNEAKLVNIAPDSIKQQILADYIRSCERGLWRKDKGIVLLYEYQNEQQKPCWYLSSSIDDGYKANPPRRFMDFQGDIILIFEGRATGYDRYATTETSALIQCLEQIVGDRVYTRPTIRSRWTNQVLPTSNKKMTVGQRRISGGNGGDLIIIFNADGSYHKMLPV